MKKFLITLFIIFSPLTTHGANIILDIELKDIENNPIADFVINQSSGVGQYKYLITDELGKMSASFEYDTNESELLSFLLNGNRISLSDADGSQKALIITYNTEKQNIENVSYQGGFIISNQEITKSTNYYLLIGYIFFTILLGTIIVLSRVFYIKSQIDIVKHNQQKRHM